MHGGSPKGTEKSGGLDVEAEECTEEVQKRRIGESDRPKKQRKARKKSIR